MDWNWKLILSLLNNDNKLSTTWYESYHIKYKAHDDVEGFLTIGEVAINEHPDMIVIYKLQIYEQFRRKGFARQFLIDLTKQYNKIRLAVAKDNTGAIALYSSLGFKKIGEKNTWDWMELDIKV